MVQLFFHTSSRLSKNRGVLYIVTGEIDSSSLQLKELIPFEPKFDMDYLKEKIAVSTPVWSGVDVDEYLQDIRGGLS